MKIKQNKQNKTKVHRLYYLDGWIQIIQSDVQNKSSIKMYKSPNNTVS